MNTPLTPSAFLLPSLYISAGGQHFAIPPDIAVVQIATIQEPVSADRNLIQLLFQAPQPTGLLLHKSQDGSWWFFPYNEVIQKKDGQDRLIKQDLDKDRSRVYPLTQGAHLFVLGGEEIGIVVPPGPARLLEGATGLYSFQSSFEKAETTRLHSVLNINITDRPLSARTADCLQNADILWVGELVLRTENDLLRVRNMGQKSIDEIKKILADLSAETGIAFSLGMRPEQLHGWQPSQG